MASYLVKLKRVIKVKPEDGKKYYHALYTALCVCSSMISQQ